MFSLDFYLLYDFLLSDAIGNWCFLPLFFHELVYDWLLCSSMIDHILFPDILYPILDRLNHVYKLVIRKIFELWLLDQFWYSFVSLILFSFIFNSLEFCLLIFDRCLNPFLRKFSYIETIGRSAIEEWIISLENLCSLSHEVTFWVFGLFLEGCMNELIWWTAYRPSHIIASAVESWSHIDLIDLSIPSKTWALSKRLWPI